MDGFVENGSLLQVGFFEIISRISTNYTLLPDGGLTPYLSNIEENRLKFSQGTISVSDKSHFLRETGTSPFGIFKQ